jgi:hypothetical protein
MKVPGFVGQTYQMDALTFDAQRLINMYPITSETGTSKSVAALRSIPGYDLYATAGGGAIRGAKRSANGRAFVVSGDTLYEITSGGSATSRGTVLTFTSRVSIAENQTQMMIVDGTYGYIYTYATDTLTQITDIDFPTCATVTYLDGYFIVPETDTNNFYISAINNGLSWDALDFTNAAAGPDSIVSCFADGGNLWVFGQETTEVFTNTGNAEFPFERIDQAISATGCAAAHTVQSFDNTVVWLGVDDKGKGIVWKASGYSASRISTQAIESKIASVNDFSDSYAYVYHEQGHIFYVLQISNLDTTLVYDGSTQAWHERMWYDSDNIEMAKHRGSCHFFFDNKNLIGDRENGKIYVQSLAYYDFDGDEIQRERVSPHMQDEKKNISFSNFELDIETGVGLQSGQGSDPQISMQYSDDGGRTWSNERFTTIGAAGKYKNRVRWSRCGSARDRVWKVRYTEPTEFQINEAYFNVA